MKKYFYENQAKFFGKYFSLTNFFNIKKIQKKLKNNFSKNKIA